MGLLSDYLPSLPTDPGQNDAARQGLLAFGAAMLGGRGNFGQILGQGLAAGAGGYNSALQALQQKALVDAQTKHYTLANDADQAALDQNKAISAGIANFQTQQPSAPTAAASLVAGPQAALPSLSSVPQASPAPDAGLPLSMIPQASSAPAVPVKPVADLPQVGAAPAAVDPSSDYQKARALAIYLNTNFPGSKQAADALKAVDALKPKFSTEFRVAKGADGNLHNYLVSEDGTLKDAGVGVKPDMKSTDLGGQVVWNDANAITPGQSFTKTVTPGEALQSQDQAKSRAQAERHWQAEQNAGDNSPITDAAIVNAAARYNLDGTLPPMGMGANAAAGRSRILNKAAELAAGIDPTEQRAMQLAYKGDVKAKAAAVQAFTSGKLGNTVRSFNVLQSHLDTFSNMADALDNGNMQALNKISNAWAAQTGKAAPTNFEAIKHIVGDEIVKAVTGSAGALGDREAAAKTIASINSPAQLKGVIESYRELANGQLQGLRQQYQTSTGRNDFDRYLSDSAKASSKGGDVKPVAALPQKSKVVDFGSLR